MRHQVSRRRFLCMTAGVAVATVPLGMANAVAAQVPEDRRLIPAHKVGTITFTQRDVPGRLGIAASDAMGVAPTMGCLGGPDFPEDPTDLGPLVPLPGGWRELFEFLAKVGFEQIEFAGYGQNADNPGGAAPNPAPGGVTTPESRAAYLAYGRTLRGLPRRVRAGSDRQPRLHPEHLAGPEQPGWRHVDERLRALPDRARVRRDPGHALHGYRQRPDEREQPQHRSVGRSPARSGTRSTRSASSRVFTSTRTTTRRPTTSSRTARW